ncbi:MAG: hypothetical protein EOO10_02745 [Chitinophagaceae bacterium]|nr:MAG: hypothetical protein EOO10_02745 [Chitinophagaceae bacterium]
MEKKNISIATISWARNEAEENLLKASLTELASLNIPVYVTDGGSTASFLAFIQSIPHFTLLQPDGKGVYAQAKTSLLAAYNAGYPFIFYTEPDKEAFFRSGLQKLLDESTTDEKTGIYHASRSAKGFSTFPAFQQMTETTINNCCKELIERDHDYTYGPFLLNSILVPYLHEVKEDIGWGWRPYLFTVAHRLRLKVDALIDDFICPPDQREDDQKERIYRMRQLEQNIRGIVLGATVQVRGE